ncbi:MAG: AbgT family transporter [Pseudomonadales bacterium]|nr:AbgT family transporter [Pseudomonadales bacterium]MDP6471480.1 AbgT family transporter [Pseudomonadales bacterium]MDP6828649.1 AbgT family transporter [Pseudomonadales bacterium]MDP6972368.1 AbgT family transporter [Pseudomonadales bacterium]
MSEENADGDPAPEDTPEAGVGLAVRLLDRVEALGNRLPDPALLFALLLVVVWLCSWAFSHITFSHIDPRSGEPVDVVNLMTGAQFTSFFSSMVSTFVTFHPLGVVLLAMLGIGVADHSGFIRTGLKGLLNIAPARIITPMVLLIAIVSHSAVDAGYVLVIPLGAVIFQAAGRHPLAGIAAAFAGVSGGFSANFVPSALDPMLQGISQAAAQILDPAIVLNPLNNWFFTSASTLLIVGLGWYVTDRIVEPRLSGTAVDGELADAPALEALTPGERKGLTWSLIAVGIGMLALFASVWPESSPWRAPDGQIATSAAPLMRSIVALIFLVFLLPGVVYGYVSRAYLSHRDIVAGMTQAMSGLGYYLVMAFFAALFIAEFSRSNLGALLALEGAALLKAAAMPAAVTVIGVIVITGIVNLFVGSASAKWALLAPILVPMLMQLGISPDLAQAAYRVGDSSTNIITPLMPYFPLVVVFCQRYVRSTGIGTVVAMMLPFSVGYLVVWTVFLLLYWFTGLPLGLQASYLYASY